MSIGNRTTFRFLSSSGWTNRQEGQGQGYRCCASCGPAALCYHSSRRRRAGRRRRGDTYPPRTHLDSHPATDPTVDIKQCRSTVPCEEEASDQESSSKARGKTRMDMSCSELWTSTREHQSGWSLGSGEGYDCWKGCEPDQETRNGCYSHFCLIDFNLRLYLFSPSPMGDSTAVVFAYEVATLTSVLYYIPRSIQTLIWFIVRRRKREGECALK